MVFHYVKMTLSKSSFWLVSGKLDTRKGPSIHCEAVSDQFFESHDRYNRNLRGGKKCFFFSSVILDSKKDLKSEQWFLVLW